MVLKHWWQRVKNYYGAHRAARTGYHPDRYVRQAMQQIQPLVPAEQPLSHPAMVFDLETTGLNTRYDKVISIGAVQLQGPVIALNHSYYQLLNVDVDLSGDSQLIHGLTQADLRMGAEPKQALVDFFHYSQNHIWLAFHAEFDRRMLRNATTQHLGWMVDPQPIDIAYLAALLYPDQHHAQAGLDYWLAQFQLPILARHNAAADALASAELLLILLHKAQQVGFKTWGELHQACLNYRQVQRALA